ncbi:MAG: flavin reductase family protein [Oscillospiraceae bacterium]|nr:flavin reductase family protein [Oscillospiraceae bacterium]
MKEITVGQAQRLTSPSPFGLLSTRDSEGKVNLMAISWWTYLTNHPPKLGVCLSNKGYSGELIRKTGEFALNIVGEELKEAGLKCGQISGRTCDKCEQFGIETVPASNISGAVIPGSRVIFECRLTDSFPVGDHTMYVGDIVSVSGDDSVKQLYAFDGYGRLDTV